MEVVFFPTELYFLTNSSSVAAQEVNYFPKFRNQSLALSFRVAGKSFIFITSIGHTEFHEFHTLGFAPLRVYRDSQKVYHII